MPPARRRDPSVWEGPSAGNVQSLRPGARPVAQTALPGSPSSGHGPEAEHRARTDPRQWIRAPTRTDGRKGGHGPVKVAGSRQGISADLLMSSGNNGKNG